MHLCLSSGRLKRKLGSRMDEFPIKKEPLRKALFRLSLAGAIPGHTYTVRNMSACATGSVNIIRSNYLVFPPILLRILSSSELYYLCYLLHFFCTPFCLSSTPFLPHFFRLIAVSTPFLPLFSVRIRENT